MAARLPATIPSSPVSTASAPARSMLSKALTNSLGPRSRKGCRLTPSDSRRHLHCLELRHGGGIVGVQEDRHPGDARLHLLEQLDSFRPELRIEEALPRDIPAEPRDAGNEAGHDRVARSAPRRWGSSSLPAWRQ